LLLPLTEVLLEERATPIGDGGRTDDVDGGVIPSDDPGRVDGNILLTVGGGDAEARTLFSEADAVVEEEEEDDDGENNDGTGIAEACDGGVGVGVRGVIGPLVVLATLLVTVPAVRGVDAICVLAIDDDGVNVVVDDDDDDDVDGVRRGVAGGAMLATVDGGRGADMVLFTGAATALVEGVEGMEGVKGGRDDDNDGDDDDDDDDGNDTFDGTEAAFGVGAVTVIVVDDDDATDVTLAYSNNPITEITIYEYGWYV
jgi:hypothetical protein